MQLVAQLALFYYSTPEIFLTMKTSLFLRTLTLGLLPALLTLASCGGDDADPIPAPDQGRIRVYHAAANAEVALKFLIDDAEKASLSYGQASDYQVVNAGSHILKTNVASSNTTVASQTVTVEKDKRYSYFTYANAPTTQAGLFVTDDLAAPSAGKAKIRLVNLGQGAANPVKLSTTVASVADIAGTETQFANASGFVEILPGSYNVAVTTGATSETVTNGNVGDGTGAGTVANKTYEAGKIYTVVYRGITGSTVKADLQPRVFLIQNN